MSLGAWESPSFSPPLRASVSPSRLPSPSCRVIRTHRGARFKVQTQQDPSLFSPFILPSVLAPCHLFGDISGNMAPMLWGPARLGRGSHQNSLCLMVSPTPNGSPVMQKHPRAPVSSVHVSHVSRVAFLKGSQTRWLGTCRGSRHLPAMGVTDVTCTSVSGMQRLYLGSTPAPE